MQYLSCAAKGTLSAASQMKSRQAPPAGSSTAPLTAGFQGHRASHRWRLMLKFSLLFSSHSVPQSLHTAIQWVCWAGSGHCGQPQLLLRRRRREVSPWEPSSPSSGRSASRFDSSQGAGGAYRFQNLHPTQQAPHTEASMKHAPISAFLCGWLVQALKLHMLLTQAPV